MYDLNDTTYLECSDEPLPHAELEVSNALRLLEVEALNFGKQFIRDASVREAYLSHVARYSSEILSKVENGALSPKQGASMAREGRNAILEASRLSSSDMGRAMAIQMKGIGRTLPELLEAYALKAFRRNFVSLVAHEQNEVYLAIIEAAGRANPGATQVAMRLGRVGRGLWILSFGIAVFEISRADDPLLETAHQATTLGSGALGAAGAGTLVAPLICAATAPVCVGLTVFVGGALAAFGSDALWHWSID